MTTHTHHWLIASPQAGRVTVDARCIARGCPTKKRTFPDAFDNDGVWNSPVGKAANQMDAAKGRMGIARRRAQRKAMPYGRKVAG